MVLVRHNSMLFIETHGGGDDGGGNSDSGEGDIEDLSAQDFDDSRVSAILRIVQHRQMMTQVKIVL